MTHDLLYFLLGIVAGIASGFFFERRATKSAESQAKAAEAHNLELRQKLADLREGVYVTGRVDDPPRPFPSTDLPDAVMTWIRVVQDAQGRVSVARVRAHFIPQGHPSAAVDLAIATLLSSGSMRRQGKQLEVL